MPAPGPVDRHTAQAVFTVVARVRPDRTVELYLRSIEGKTASLLGASCRIGGLVADIPGPHLDALTTFGHSYGMAFQIVDDVLDVVATDEQLGKPAGHDLVEGAYNLPVIRALKGPEGDELRSVLGGPISGEPWERARDLVRRSDAIDQSVAVAQSYVDRAVELLVPFGERPHAVALAGAARHLLTDLNKVRATTA